MLNSSKKKLPIAMIGGAFMDPVYLWPNHRKKFNAHVVGENFDLYSNIKTRAQNILHELKNIGSPVFLCGHSLGALIAYQVAQEAPEGLVRGTALVCPAMIGTTHCVADWTSMVQLATNPFGLMRQVLKLLPNRPESVASLIDLLSGDIKVGKKLENVLVVGGTHDIVTPMSYVRIVSERVGGSIVELDGGHDIPISDHSGKTLALITKHLHKHA